MANLSDDLLDALVARSLALLRVDAGFRRPVVRLLIAMQGDIVARMARDSITASQRARLNSLLSDVRGYIDTTYGTISRLTADNAFDLMQAETLYVAATLNRLTASGLFSAIADTGTLRTLVDNVLIQGAPSAKWWNEQSRTLAFRFEQQMRLGIAENETIDELVRRVRGSRALGVPGIMETTRRNAEALVRSSVATVANVARLETYRRNADVLAGVQQISTLDGRTTPVCVAYAGACWNLEGKPIRGTVLAFNGGPPRHWNCRSTLLPLTKTFRELGADRDEIPKGRRASIDGEVAADLSFADWLRGKPLAFADDMLGRGRAQLWRDGRITLQQLVDGTGRELTLAQLRARYA